MSGHSKWSKVKHQKAVTDATKSSEFTKASRAITVAVREGGGSTDPDGNFRLRLAIELARSVNMPKETIARAVERAVSSNEQLVSVLYEGFGSDGVAILVEALTDNKQRTAAIIKNIFDRHGGSLGGPGSVVYMFRRVGCIFLSKEGRGLNTTVLLALDVGGDDVEENEDEYILFTKAAELHLVAERLKEKGIAILRQELWYHPVVRAVANDSVQETVGHLAKELDEAPDIQNVFTNL